MSYIKYAVLNIYCDYLVTFNTGFSLQFDGYLYRNTFFSKLSKKINSIVCLLLKRKTNWSPNLFFKLKWWVCCPRKVSLLPVRSLTPYTFWKEELNFGKCLFSFIPAKGGKTSYSQLSPFYEWIQKTELIFSWARFKIEEFVASYIK